MITDSRGLSNVFEWRCGMSVGMFREITANVKLYLEIQFPLLSFPLFLSTQKLLVLSQVHP